MHINEILLLILLGFAFIWVCPILIILNSRKTIGAIGQVVPCTLHYIPLREEQSTPGHARASLMDSYRERQ